MNGVMQPAGVFVWYRSLFGCGTRLGIAAPQMSSNGRNIESSCAVGMVKLCLKNRKIFEIRMRSLSASTR